MTRPAERYPPRPESTAPAPQIWAASLRQAALELPLSLLGSVILGFYVPWSLVWQDTIPGGGDNPTHPVLMQMLGDALFSHLHVVHYAYGFWGGFEAFQFYFPLPYAAGALLVLFVPANIAFKLVTLFGILALPPAFYWMARSLRMPLACRVLASVLSVPFLFTEAHVMWGGNIFSALAGMIGNAWGFTFFVPAFGEILEARRRGGFSVPAVVLSVLAALCHFYALLMLLMLFVAFAIEDGVVAAATRHLPSASALRPYAIGVVSILLMSWWIVPLVAYFRYSCDLGGGWVVKLFSTFTLAEKVGFGLALIVCVADVFATAPRDPARVTVLVFLALYLLLFQLNDRFETTIFMDPRIWPTIYFSGYALMVLGFDSIARYAPPPVFAALVAPLWFLVPSDVAFAKAQSWMVWNYRGATQAPGWGDFRQVVDILRREPPGRVSYESSNEANGTLGSVRAPELLPRLAGQDIMLGGIVNSASFPGIGYFQQCLMSNECAGWPPGSVMPEKDISRAIWAMRTLGIRYHVALRGPNRDLFAQSPEVEALYKGAYASLFRLKEAPSLVEVFDRPLPVFCARRFATTMVNLPRWDITRDTGLVFERDCTKVDPDRRIDPTSLFNFLLDEWNSGRRVYDRGWADRTDRIQNRLNGFVFSRRRPFDEEDVLHGDGMEFFIADRTFDRDLFLSFDQEGYSEVAAPLLRSAPGKGRVTIVGRGYRAFVGERELDFGKANDIDFEGDPAFRWILFKPIRGERYRNVELSTSDPLLRSGLPGPAGLELPTRITSACHARVDRDFHRLILHTDCVGKPHLIKYSYFPKWRSTEEVKLGTNGFMVIVPKSERTVLEHRWGLPDWLGTFISLATAFALAGGPVYRRSRANSTSRHTKA